MKKMMNRGSPAQFGGRGGTSSSYFTTAPPSPSQGVGHDSDKPDHDFVRLWLLPALSRGEGRVHYPFPRSRTASR